MATNKCPQCGKEVQAYRNGLLSPHKRADFSDCPGSLSHPEHPEYGEGVGYQVLPGGYKYSPGHQRDPHKPSKPLPR